MFAWWADAEFEAEECARAWGLDVADGCFVVDEERDRWVCFDPRIGEGLGFGLWGYLRRQRMRRGVRL